MTTTTKPRRIIHGTANAPPKAPTVIPRRLTTTPVDGDLVLDELLAGDVVTLRLRHTCSAPSPTITISDAAIEALIDRLTAYRARRRGAA